MKDNLGRFWKVDRNNHAFVCYTKKGEAVKELYKIQDVQIAREKHKKCGGDVYGFPSTLALPGFLICGKCAAEIKEKRVVQYERPRVFGGSAE